MVEYDWKSYEALESGESLFARRNHDFQKACSESVSYLDPTIQFRGFSALEFGIGTGGSAKYFLERHPSMLLTGVDVDPRAIADATANLIRHDRGLVLDCADFLNYNSDHKHDLVYGVFVTHNFPKEDKKAFIDQGLEILTPGGYLVLGDVMTYDEDESNKRMWEYDYNMIEELPEADFKFWKEHFDKFDRPHSSPLSFYEDHLKSVGADSTVTYKDGFWTVLCAQKPL